MTYLHCPDRPQTLSREWVASEYAELVERLPAAEASEGAEAWLELFSKWNELKSYVHSEQARLNYAFSKDLTDAEAEEAERVHREEVIPAAESGDAELVAALLASRHQQAVSERFGAQLLRVLKVTEATLAPVNSELRVQVGDLAKQYDKLVASGEVEVGGERLTLARARGRLTSAEPGERREAFEAYYGWFLANRDALADIYDRQVGLRDRMGKQLGHANFVPLGYAGMERTDYGPVESATFRDAVRRFAAPLFQRICEQQAELLGEPSLRPWDAGYHPGLTLPMGVAQPIDEQLDKAGRIFERLSPKLSAHFERMRAEGLIDLENRKGKGAGAYCTSFSDEGRVAIFCNSTGDESDVKTLTHEMGHAFQGWESQWIEAVDLRWPSADACEIHSMGMEFLSLPHLGEYFGEEGGRALLAQPLPQRGLAALLRLRHRRVPALGLRERRRQPGGARRGLRPHPVDLHARHRLVGGGGGLRPDALVRPAAPVPLPLLLHRLRHRRDRGDAAGAPGRPGPRALHGGLPRALPPGRDPQPDRPGGVRGAALALRPGTDEGPDGPRGRAPRRLLGGRVSRREGPR